MISAKIKQAIVIASAKKQQHHENRLSVRSKQAIVIASAEK